MRQGLQQRYEHLTEFSSSSLGTVRVIFRLPCLHHILKKLRARLSPCTHVPFVSVREFAKRAERQPRAVPDVREAMAHNASP